VRLRRAIAAALLLAASAAGARSLFEGADPSALFVGGRMWIYPTGDGERLEAWASADRNGWTRRGTLLRQADIAWIGDDHAPQHFLWAPHMLAAKGRYYLYYSVGPQDPTPSRIGVAVCESPAGPCKDSGKPLVTGGDGFEAIDPMGFTDPKTGRHLLYAGGSAGATLRVWELGADLVSIARELRVDQPTQFTEGAFMHERGGVYYLSYSHGRWNAADYSVRYATAPSPTGPWTDRGTILASQGAYKGPGHHAFVRDPKSGRWLIVYHRWEGVTGDGPFQGRRRVAIQPIDYDASGLIVPVRISD
jgi:beta-xylosidase